MPWSLTIGRIGGTAVKIHITFLLFLAWIGFSAWEREGPAAALSSLIFILLLFLCVTLHEFGHILMARRFGIETPMVTLLPIGGVASLERLPTKPMQEFLVAIAGPAVNLVIGGVLILLLGRHRAGATVAARRPECFAARTARRGEHLSRGLQPHPRLSHGWRPRAARLSLDQAGPAARDASRGDDRPGARVRIRLSRSVRQSASPVHRDLHIHRRLRRGADELAAGSAARAERRRRDGDALHGDPDRSESRAGGRGSDVDRPARIPGRRQLQQACRHSHPGGHPRCPAEPRPLGAGRILHAVAGREREPPRRPRRFCSNGYKALLRVRFS